MLNFLEDQFIGDAVSRAEQSRVSYNLQTEEFRTLNANLELYLGDIRTIDDDNHQLQENIGQIRTDYVSTLENHLTRLPNDFRQRSQTLTEANLERYKSKTRARRLINEREELKRRINFIATNEKQQIKRLSILERQERSIHSEFNKLKEQIQSLINYVEGEKQIHRQAMDKVDSLHLHLERACVDRSKTEFEIQTLKEEVKIMQTANEFLSEERETILSTQIEANEYFLSRLNDSISRIREDFDQLNKSQLKQTEHDYKQTLQILEENLITTEKIDQTNLTYQQTAQIERQQLQDEHRSVLQDLTILNDQNQTLSQRVLALEGNLYSLRGERQQELLSKDNEFERSKIELQKLNEKLNHLAEYDRNLKFELTLYRGVLESECRRKQQQSTVNTSQLIRPTTLPTNNNSMTDRSTWLTSSTNQSKFTDQEQEEILNTRDRVQSEYDTLGDEINAQFNDVISTKTPPENEKVVKEENLGQKLTEPINWDQQQDKINIDVISQGNQDTPGEVQKSSTDAEATSMPLITAAPAEEKSTVPIEVQQSSSPASSTSVEIKSQTQKTPTTSERQSLDQTTSPTRNASISSEVHQSPSTSPKEQRTPSDVQRSLSTSSSTSAEIQSQIQKPSTPSELRSFDQTTSPTSNASISSEVRQSPSTPLQEQHTPSEARQSPSTSAEIKPEPQKSPTTSELRSLDQTTSPTSNASISSEVRQLSSTPPREYQTSSDVLRSSSTSSSISAGASSDIQKSPTSSTAAKDSEDQFVFSEVRRLPSTPSNEVQSFPTVQSTSPTSKAQIISTSPEGRQTPSELAQSSSRSSSISAGTPSDSEKSPFPFTIPTVTEHQSPSSEVHQSPSLPPEDRQTSSELQQSSSRTSSTSAGTPSESQLSSTSPKDHQTSSNIEQPFIASTGDRSTLTESRQSPTKSQEDRSILSDVEQSTPTSFEEHQTPSEIQKQTSAIIADDDHEMTWASLTGGVKTSPTTFTTGDFGSESQWIKSSDKIDDNVEYEEFIRDDSNLNESHQSINSIGSSSMEEYEVSLDTKPSESKSPSLELSNIEEERKQNLLESDISLVKDNKSELKQQENSNQTKREEVMSSSLPTIIEEDKQIRNISSAHDQNKDNKPESNLLTSQDASKQSSHDTSLADVEEVGLSTSQKLEIKTSDDADNPNLVATMQDLCDVFHELANDQDLVEINNELPDKLVGLLEFHDNLKRTLFYSLLGKYLVQAADQSDRDDTLDWFEFRDILFPIITGRYLERHIRKLFNLFDTTNTGYLPVRQIAELLEVLHANDPTDLARNIVDEYDTDYDGKLHVDELIEAIKKSDDINEHVLSNETETKQWFNQSPAENQTISIQVPRVNFSSKIDQTGIPLLGDIFKKVGANSENKQLDGNIKNLSVKITNEFLENNISISNNDLELFVELFLEKKENSLINWIEFRDVFLPIVSNGFYSKNDIERWFNIFDRNHTGIITREQIIHLLRLLQAQNPEDIMKEFNQIAETHKDDKTPWTFDELIFVLYNVDETAVHLVSDNEQIQQTSSFDITWLSNNVF